ncbi:hypothetical protein DL771_002204 [Monosporascus sp. 5C6A]|nr:hypothetical protein DL771_002204 [Monosporascus sp. 5C6A]
MTGRLRLASRRPGAFGDGPGLRRRLRRPCARRTIPPFVWAYRLRRITYRRKKAAKQREYVKWDLVGFHDDDEQAGSRYDGDGDGDGEEDAAYGMQLKGLEPEDEDLPGTFDLRVDDAVTGDGDICRVAFDAPDSDDSRCHDG